MKIITTTSAEETQLFGAAFAAVLPAGATLLLSGDLGAGKTQFVKGLAAGLGSSDDVTSPTFNLMHVYTSLGWPVLYHFDLYRLDDAEQLDDLDYYSYLESEVICAIEWGDRFPDALPEDYLLLDFGYGNTASDSNTAALNATAAQAAAAQGADAQGATAAAQGAAAPSCVAATAAATAVTQGVAATATQGAAAPSKDQREIRLSAHGPVSMKIEAAWGQS
jgi:tRNA threonylcarbamoyladenosine biosynthesis protein TsaE